MKHYIRQVEGEFLHILDGGGWFYSKSPYPGRLPNNSMELKYDLGSHLSNAVINVCERCNGTCKYCYQSASIKRSKVDDLTIEQIGSFIDNINEKAKSLGFEGLKSVELFGGEPLLRPDRFEVIDYLLNRGLKVKIATNGHMPFLKQSVIDKYAKNENIHFRISIDGHCPEVHERYRTKGSFFKIIENIKYLKSQGANISIKTIINDHNFEYLKEILSFIRDDLQIDKWNYNVMYNWGLATSNNLTRHIDHLQVAKKLTTADFAEFWPLMHHTPLCQMLSSIYIQSSYRFLRTYPFLDYTGSVYIHDQLINKDWKLGDFSSFDIDKFVEWVRLLETDRPSCKGCFNREYCYLGNFGETYAKDKTLDSEFPTCDTLREVTLFLMSLKTQGAQILDSMLNGDVYGFK